MYQRLTGLQKTLALKRGNCIEDNKDKEINRLLGKDPLQGLCKLGLSPDWAVNVISQVGNYAESFERNLYPLTIVRGMNALHKDGGLHYIPPIK